MLPAFMAFKVFDLFESASTNLDRAIMSFVRPDVLSRLSQLGRRGWLIRVFLLQLQPAATVSGALLTPVA